jgi:hypothetical protein
MPFTSDKKSQGWWFVREIIEGYGGRSEAKVVAECEQRNRDRLESKRVSAKMAREEYEKARDSFSPKAVVEYLRKS